MKKLLYSLFVLVSIVIISCSNSDSKSNSDDDTDQMDQQDDTNDDDDNNDDITSSSAVSTYGQLSVSGKNLVDENGTPIQLRGMSLSWTNWWPQFYTADVVAWLKEDFKVNIVRAAMGIDEAGGYLDDKEKHKNYVFTVIDAAIEEGIYVIVDWHSHHAEDYEEDAKNFFTEVAQKYGDQPNIIYETYNEPLDTASWNDVIKPYHEAVIAEIRKYDDDNVIIAGSRSWSTRLDEVVDNRIDDVNLMYTLHYYAASHKQELRDEAQEVIDANLPIFVTEYGVTEYTGDGFVDVVEANNWWAFLDANKISWCNWSIADKEESSAAVKPGASPNGAWPESMLTQSGLLVREEIRSKNPEY